MLEEAKDLNDILEVNDIARAAAEYARAAKLGLEAQNTAAEIALRAQRKAGDYLSKIPKEKNQHTSAVPMSGQHNEDRPIREFYDNPATWRKTNAYRKALEESGTTTQDASRWQRIANIPEPQFEAFIEETKARGEELTTNKAVKVANNITVAANHYGGDDGDEWYTPPEIIEASRNVMGLITLDPATCIAAQKKHKAQRYYTKEEDGLSKKWVGNVFLNPPYSTPLINLFIDKAVSEYDNGNMDQAVIVVNNSSDTKWFHSLANRFHFCITRGRLKFWRNDRESFSARQGQCIFYLGKNTDGFIETFSRFGIVVKKA